jgi:YHS domain-containing protein
MENIFYDGSARLLDSSTHWNRMRDRDRQLKGANGMIRLVTSVAALALAFSLGGPAAAKSHKGTKAATCPVCSMKLSTKKSKATPVAMKVNGKTYYCCDKCNMSTKKASAAAPKCPSCGMQLSAMKTAAAPAAVKVNGKTYYCCDACDMSKSKG